MKHNQIELISIWFVAVLLAGCDKKEAPQTSTAVPENPAVNKPAQQPKAPPKVAVDTQKDGDNESTRLELKQKYPELVLSPDRPNPVGNRLKRELEGLHPNGAEFASKLSDLWAESLARLPEQGLKSASKVEIANGTLLPTELAGNPSVDIREDTPLEMLKGVSYFAVAGRDDMLAEFAKQRMNILPPTSIDIEVFGVLNSSIQELNPGRKLSRFESWEKFSSAANPLYRLLALRAALRTTPQAASTLSSEDPSYNRINGSAKLDFYLSFFDEIDPIILTEAVVAVATVPTSEARQAIEKFRAQQLQKGDAVLLHVSEDALRSQKNISP